MIEPVELKVEYFCMLSLGGASCILTDKQYKYCHFRNAVLLRVFGLCSDFFGFREILIWSKGPFSEITAQFFR